MAFSDRPLGLLLVMASAIVLEGFWRLAIARKGYDAPGAAASLGVALGNLVFGAVTALVLAGVYAWAYSLAPVRWPLANPWTWAVGFLAVEFAYYWQHRFSHTVRWMWATHAVHHSAEELTLPAALRLGWTNLISGGWVMFVPLMLAGLDPRLVLALLAFNLHYQFFLHTEATGRLGPLDWVLNTPLHHRVHHASNPEALDRNFGGVLIIFDRLFGTFAEPPPHEPLRFGLTRPVASNNPLRIAFCEWGRLLADVRAARTAGEVLRALFGRPA